MDIFERVKKQRGNIGQYAKEAHGYFAFPKLEGEIGPRMMFRGKEVLNWSLNNYIGLANDLKSGKSMQRQPLNGGWLTRWEPV